MLVSPVRDEFLLVLSRPHRLVLSVTLSAKLPDIVLSQD